MAEKGQLSFEQRLAAYNEQRKQGKTVGQELSEAQEGFLYSGAFFGAVADMDALGKAYFQNVLGYPSPKANAEWNKKSWAEQVDSLTSLAPNSEVAQRALNGFRLFQESDLVWQTFQEVIDKFGRPSRRIEEETQFGNFLYALKKEGLAAEFPERPSDRRAFLWKGRWHTRTGLLKSRFVWPFVVKTLGRVRHFTEIQEVVLPRIQPLLGQADLESNWEEQNLHKLLTFQNQVGTMVLWDENLRFGQEEIGLLAVLIGRMVPGATSLVLTGWVADQPLSLPSEEAYELPPLMVYERPEGGLEVMFQQVQLPKEEWASIRRILRLIRRWLGQEGKFRIPALQQPQQPQKAQRKRKR